MWHLAPRGVYQIAPRSGLVVKHHIDISASVVDGDYRGEVGVVLFNHSEEDFKVRIGDRIAQLILERIKTPPVKEVADLEETMRGEKGYGSTGLGAEPTDPSRVATLQRVHGRPKIKRTTSAQGKREFVSMKKMKKLMKQKEQVFLCIVRADPNARQTRRSRGGKKKAALCTQRVQSGMTEKTKREISKEVGPKKKFLSLQEKEKEVVEGAPKEHQAELQNILAEFRDVFRDELPKGPPPTRDVTLSIEVSSGSKPVYRTPYRLRPNEQDDLEEQVRDLLVKGSYVQAIFHTAHPVFSFLKKTVAGGCASTTVRLIDRR